MDSDDDAFAMLLWAVGYDCSKDGAHAELALAVHGLTVHFSILALFAALASTTVVQAAPAPLFTRAACRIASCMLDLAPVALACATAASQEGANIISDASCLVAAAKVIDEFPETCDGCVDGKD
ncbi:hypothetical protein C8J57DRAFT_1713786 [Mycena rebaudengoi]|nr:hypothetical protein C8J57DRAFT_1713786 [Mycena rebaudengoi]